ncbi:GIY-YIG nuclease family protein [Brevundimonas kwangchunensis]
MSRIDRKALVAAYKEEQTPVAGVYAVICGATGEAWVGRSLNIDRQQNSLWFTLKSGTFAYRALQSAWTEHGEGAFRFEQLDRLCDDLSPMARDTELKERSTRWRDRLGAEGI